MSDNRYLDHHRSSKRRLERIEPDDYALEVFGDEDSNDVMARLNNVDDIAASSYIPFPTFNLYNRKTSPDKAVAISESIGKLRKGQTFGWDGEAAFRTDGMRVALLASFSFFGYVDWDNKGRLAAAWETEPPESEYRELRKVYGGEKQRKPQEMYFAALLHFDADEREWGLTVSRLLGATGRFVRDLERGISQSMTPEYLRGLGRTSPKIAKLLSSPGFPPRLRNPGHINTEEKGQGIEQFFRLTATCSSLSLAEGAYIAEMWKGEGMMQEGVGAALKAFDQRVSYVRRSISFTRNAKGSPSLSKPHSSKGRDSDGPEDEDDDFEAPDPRKYERKLPKSPLNGRSSFSRKVKEEVDDAEDDDSDDVPF